MSMARRKRIEIASEFCMDLLGEGQKAKQADSSLHSIQPTAVCLPLRCQLPREALHNNEEQIGILPVVPLAPAEFFIQWS